MNMPSVLSILFSVFFGCCQSQAQVTYSYDPSDENFPNPERGLYAFTYLAAEPSSIYEDLWANGTTLVYSALLLDCCRTANISAPVMANINANFTAMRSAGVKGIIRILYTEAVGGQDTTLEWAAVHLQQLQPVFEANKDVIAFFQAGIIGEFGEWHDSSNGLDTPSGRAAVWGLLTTYLPACVPIQVRTPAFVYELEGGDLPLQVAQLFNCSPAALIGHHNDCWLGSATDVGTYISGADREAWLTALEYDTQFVPWGGETCSQSELSNCVTALSEAERMHATYLNGEFNLDVIAELAPCWSSLQKKLGYRLQLQSCDLPASITPGESFDYEINLLNVGWAPPYKERPIVLRLFSPSQPGTLITEYALEDNIQFFSPEAGTITLSGTLIAPEVMSEAEIGFALALPDANLEISNRSEYAIRFANLDVWDEGLGQNILARQIPVNLPSPVAIVSGDLNVCPGESASLHVDLEGVPPWSLTWSDGFTQSNIHTSPLTRTVQPNSTTTYTLTNFSDGIRQGIISGSATVTLDPGLSLVSQPLQAQGLQPIVLDPN